MRDAAGLHGAPHYRIGVGQLGQFPADCLRHGGLDRPISAGTSSVLINLAQYRITDLMAVVGIGGMDEKTTNRVLRALTSADVGGVHIDL